MSYQGWACSGWRMDWDYIKSILPKETEDFENACDIEDIAFTLDMQDEIDENVAFLLDTLTEKFNIITGGLVLALGWIGYEEVSSDINGPVWFVGGVEEFTPAGKKYKDHLNYEQWVQYG